MNTALETALRAELQPSGALEEFVFEQLLHAASTIRRCQAAEAALAAATPGLDPLLDPAAAPRLRLIEQTLRRAERSFASALEQLRKLQTEARYRAETKALPATSPLVDAPAVDRHTARHKAVREQRELQALEAFLNTPPPVSGPLSTPPREKPRARGRAA